MANDETPKIELHLDGKKYVLGLKDFGGEDDLAIYRETGCTIADIFFGGRVTLFTVAALLWRHRVRNGERKLTYAEVNKALDFDAFEALIDDDEEEGDGPEA